MVYINFDRNQTKAFQRKVSLATCLMFLFFFWCYRHAFKLKKTNKLNGRQMKSARKRNKTKKMRVINVAHCAVNVLLTVARCHRSLTCFTLLSISFVNFNLFRHTLHTHTHLYYVSDIESTRHEDASSEHTLFYCQRHLNVGGWMLLRRCRTRKANQEWKL